ncbi:MAG: hypothetical protein AB1414_04875 [bacterium]
MNYKKFIELSMIISLFFFPLICYGEGKQKEWRWAGVIGVRMIDGDYYNEIVFHPEFKRGKFGIGLNLLCRWNEEDGFREEDWEEVGNIVNYIRWANKDDSPLYIYLGKLSEATLGHGFIVDRYSNQGTDTSKNFLGANIDINFKNGGVETLINDITDPRLYGGRIYFLPLKNLNNPLLCKIIIGATYVNDTKPQIGDKDNLSVYGLDFELPIYKEVLGFYTDYAKISGFGDGLSVGLGGKLNLVSVNTILGYKTEFRDLDSNFVPALFNPLYEIRRNGTSSIQQAESQTGWYSGANLDIARLILLSSGYEDLKETIAPRLHLELLLKKELFQLIIKQNISVFFLYDHERRQKGYHLLDFNAPNSTLTEKINFELSKNISLSYIYQKVYDNIGNKSQTSSFGTKVKF